MFLIIVMREWMVIIAGTTVGDNFRPDHMEIRQVTTRDKKIDVEDYYERIKLLKPAIEMLIELSGDKVRRR